MVIHESAEMYLETILKLHREGRPVRAVDVAAELGISKPSVSEQMKKLRENGYTSVSPDGMLCLTDQGREIAERIFERHLALTKILKEVGVPDDIAEQDACRVEHYISQTTFQHLCDYFHIERGIE